MLNGQFFLKSHILRILSLSIGSIMNMESYVYKPLDLSSDAIRVLRLNHDPFFDNEIQCELIETYLGDVPYEALSYTWGSMDKPLKITVDASELHVTENLYTALQYLRLPYEDRLLWVDAVCINQDNNEERGHQVGQMRLVYKMAEGVLIWLGTSDFHTERFFEAMNDPRLKEVTTAGGKAKGIKIDPGLCADFRHEFQDTFSELMARPWFRRVWILQEVATGRKATVMCGRSSVSTRVFAMVPAIVEFSIQEHCQAVLDIMPGHSRRLSWWGERQDLQTLLLKFAASEATDERDKIYALLGISSDAYNSKELVPSYLKDTQQLIHDTWSYILFNEVLDPSLHGFPKLNMIEFLGILQRLSEWTLEWFLHGGRDDMVLRLFGAKGSVVSRRAAGKTALLSTLAGRWDHDDLFRGMALHNRVDVNVVDKLGNSPLHNAVLNGRLDKVKALLSRKDILLNSSNLRHETPLIQAVRLGQQTMVKLLLAHPRTDVNHASRGRTPIALAIRLGKRYLVETLLACPKIEVSRDGFTPLTEAFKCRHSHILKQLLNSDHVDFHYRNDGAGAWTLALKAYDHDILYILISDGRIKNAVNATWQERLKEAALWGFVPAI